jgi:hypothetical protein
MQFGIISVLRGRGIRPLFYFGYNATTHKTLSGHGKTASEGQFLP